MATIVLDPGHGGTDPGAVNGTRREKDDNLRLALAVRDRLAKAGQRVVMTRDTDVFVPLGTRSAISNEINPDLFVSLHRNSSENPAAHGIAGYVQTGSSADIVSKARTVLNSIAATAPISRNNGMFEGNYAVLRNTRAPAQLQEVGFISNAEDNALFDANFDAYADGVARGILEVVGSAPSAPAPPVTPPPSSGGDAVTRSIQQVLNTRYGAGLVADGLLGSKTRTALVKSLQQELNNSYGAGLVTDGAFGPRTKAAIPIMRNGARGNLVYLMQAALYLKGYKEVVPDGVFGPKTEAAVRAFQRASGLVSDGLAGPATFERLFK